MTDFQGWAWESNEARHKREKTAQRYMVDPDGGNKYLHIRECTPSLR